MNLMNKIKKSKLNKRFKKNKNSSLNMLDSIDELYNKLIDFHKMCHKSTELLKVLFGENNYEIKMDLFELLINKLSEIQIKINVELNDMYKSTLETYSDIFIDLNTKLKGEYIKLFVNDTSMTYKLINLLDELNSDLNQIRTIELQNAESDYLHFKESLHLGVDNLLEVKKNYKTNQHTLELLQNQMEVKKENIAIIEKELSLINAGEIAKFEDFRQDLFSDLLDHVVSSDTNPKEIPVADLKIFIRYLNKFYKDYPNILEILKQLEKDILKINLNFMDLNILKIKNNNRIYFFTDREEVLSASISKINFFNYHLKSDNRIDFDTLKNEIINLKILYGNYIKLHKKIGMAYPILITSNKVIIEYLTKNIQEFLMEMASEKTTMSAKYLDKNYTKIEQGISKTFKYIEDLTIILEALTTDKLIFAYEDKIDNENTYCRLKLEYKETYEDSYLKYHLEADYKMENNYLNKRNYVTVKSQKELMLQTILNKFSELCNPPSEQKVITTINLKDMKDFKHYFYLMIYLLKISIEENQKTDKFKNIENPLDKYSVPILGKKVVDDIAIKQALGNYTQKFRISKNIQNLNNELRNFIYFMTKNVYADYLNPESIYEVEYDKEQFENNFKNILIKYK